MKDWRRRKSEEGGREIEPLITDLQLPELPQKTTQLTQFRLFFGTLGNFCLVAPLFGWTSWKVAHFLGPTQDMKSEIKGSKLFQFSSCARKRDISFYACLGLQIRNATILQGTTVRVGNNASSLHVWSRWMMRAVKEGWRGNTKASRRERKGALRRVINHATRTQTFSELVVGLSSSFLAKNHNKHSMSNRCALWMCPDLHRTRFLPPFTF